MKCIKYFKSLRMVYEKIGSLILRMIGIFVKSTPKLILFNSFGGKKFDDSPKAIYDYMISDMRFDEYELVWAFHEPEKFSIPRGRIIKTDNLNYFITALKAKCWITNSAIERGLEFKKKETLYVNTWHGTPIKLMGCDATKVSPSRVPERYYDIQTAQSKYEADIFSRVFNVNYNNFLICGLPRNDELFNLRHRENQAIFKQKLGIPENKKIILYAPTFREYERDTKLNCVLAPPISFKKWKELLGEDYVVLLRCHYEVSKILNTDIDNEFVFDVSAYPALNELMLASDMLISDYSSIIFDYSILNRPIYLYTYDYDEYQNRRGMYFDIREELPGGSISEKELVELIQKEYPYQRLEIFRKKYVTNYGNATREVVNKIYEKLNV